MEDGLDPESLAAIVSAVSRVLNGEPLKEWHSDDVHAQVQKFVSFHVSGGDTRRALFRAMALEIAQQDKKTRLWSTTKLTQEKLAAAGNNKQSSTTATRDYEHEILSILCSSEHPMSVEQIIKAGDLADNEAYEAIRTLCLKKEINQKVSKRRILYSIRNHEPRKRTAASSSDDQYDAYEKEKMLILDVLPSPYDEVIKTMSIADIAYLTNISEKVVKSLLEGPLSREGRVRMVRGKSSVLWKLKVWRD